MARIVKQRKICVEPKSIEFIPTNDYTQTVTLTLDELEAVRLADLEQLDQDSAANKMEISRATFQRIINSARKNIADSLINGKALQIKGGKYVVADDHCDGETTCENCRFKDAHK